MDHYMDHYSVLGLSTDCTEEQVKKAFREQALLYHQDKVGVAGEERMKAINNAYQAILEDLRSRPTSKERKASDFEEETQLYNKRSKTGPDSRQQYTRHLYRAPEIDWRYLAYLPTETRFTDQTRHLAWSLKHILPYAPAYDAIAPFVYYFETLGQCIDRVRYTTGDRHAKSYGEEIEDCILGHICEYWHIFDEFLYKTANRYFDLDEGDLRGSCYAVVGQILYEVKLLQIYDAPDTETAKALDGELTIESMLKESGWTAEHRDGKHKEMYQAWSERRMELPAEYVIGRARRDEAMSEKFRVLKNWNGSMELVVI